MGGKVDVSGGVSSAYSSIYDSSYGKVDVTYSPLLSLPVWAAGGRNHPNFRTDDFGVFNVEGRVFGLGGEITLVKNATGGMSLTVGAGAIAYGDFKLNMAGISPSNWTGRINGYLNWDTKLKAGVLGFGAGAGVTLQYDNGVTTLNGSFDAGIMGIRGEISQQTAKSLADMFDPWLQEVARRINPLNNLSTPIGQCFEGRTLIAVGQSEFVPISELKVGHKVLAFDPNNQYGRGTLVERKVTRIFRNITTEWLRLSWMENGESRELLCTSHHHFLDKFGNFPTIEELTNDNRATVVLSSGDLADVFVERISYSLDNAHLYEEVDVFDINVIDIVTQNAQHRGWQTYNFEVEDLHTYVAGGVRVHNTSYSWAHDLEKGVGIARAVSAINNGVPADYAVSLGRAAMGYENKGGRDGQAVGYTASGRAISVDRATYDNFIDRNGGKHATPSNRAAAVAVGAVANGASVADARAAAVRELELAGGALTGATQNYIDRRIVEQQTGSSGKGGGSGQTTATKSSSISGGSTAGTKTSSSPPASVPTPTPAPRQTSSSGSSGKGGGSGGASNQKNSGNSGSSRGRSGKPVLLDLNGGGLSISDRSNSNLFLDIGGDGYKRRTSWVGAGDGVLMIDADGDGKISDRKEIVFTDWDPSAETDMQALRQVFDTNGNGILDSADAQWSQFKIMLTNADGTISQKSLAELGIQSIDLTVDETKIAFDGGSSIDGQTTFTRTDGSTGTAATATLTHDADGYVVTETASTDVSGARTVVSKAYGKDGRLVSETSRTTSADGLSIISNFDDNGDGIVDRRLADQTTVNVDGTELRQETMRNGGGILIWSKTTQTSADEQSIIIDRDTDGGGYTTERETRIVGANNTLTITVIKIAKDGSVIGQVSNSLDSTRLERTVQTDANGDGLFERLSRHQTIRSSDGSRIERDSTWSHSGALLSRTEVSISSDNLSRAETSDIDGDGTTDFTATALTSRNSAGDTTVVEVSTARDGAVFGRTTTNISQDGLTKNVHTDVDGDSLVDRVFSDVTVLDADQSKTRTQTTSSATGVLLSRSVEYRETDGLVGTITIDSNGDGASDRVVSVTKETSGTVTETSSSTSSDGSLIGRIVKETSADGLTTTTRNDRYGQGTFDEITVDTVKHNMDGSSTQTVEKKAGNQSLINRVSEIRSEDGLTVTRVVDMNGDGMVDDVIRSVNTLYADGSQTTSIERKSGNGTVLSSENTSVSADRRITSVSGDRDGDGAIDRTELTTIGEDRTKTVDTRELSNTGVLLSRSIVTTSANGLSIQRSLDTDGDGDIDVVFSDVTSLPADGRSIRVRTSAAQNGAVIEREISTTSANGMKKTVELDQNGDGVIDETLETSITIEANGAKSVREVKSVGSTIVAATNVRTSANGLTVSSDQDLDGDGTVDRRKETTKTLHQDGGTTEVTTTRSSNAALTSKSSITTSADGMSVITTIDQNGDENVDRRVEESTDPSGLKTTVVTEQGDGGAILSRATTIVDRSGSTITLAFDKNGDGTTDTTRTTSISISDAGAKTTTQSEYSGTTTLVERATTVESANGLSKTTIYADSSLNTLRSIQETREFLQDGSTQSTITITGTNAAAESKTVQKVSADQRTAVTTKDVNGDGIVDWEITKSLEDSGASIENAVDLKADGQTAARRRTLEVSANGLVKTRTYDADGNGSGERQVIETTIPGADGRSVKTTEYKENIDGTWVLKGTEEVTDSADGLSRTSRWKDTGDGDWNFMRTLATQLASDGSAIAVDTWRKAGQKTRLVETTTSANGLTKTTRLDIDGNGSYDYAKVDGRVLETDGSSTRTITTTDSVGIVLSTVVEKTSADGLTKTIESTTSVPGATNTSESVISRVLADGSTIETKLLKNTAGQLLEKVEKEVSADGRQIITTRDVNGDGSVDQREEIRRTLDGRVITTTINYGTTGSESSRVITTLSADERSKTTEFDVNGDGVVDARRVQRTKIFADGSREVTTTETNLSTGALSSTIRSFTSADGMSFTEETDVNGDGVADQVLTETALPSGARITKITNNAAARSATEKRAGEIYWSSSIPAITETTIDPSGETKTSRVDQDGDGYFELSMKSSMLPDGSELTEIIETNPDGSIRAKGTFQTSHDGRTSVLEKDGNNDGFFEYREVSINRSNGEVTQSAVTSTPGSTVTQTRVTEVNALGKMSNQTFSGQIGSQTYSWANATGTTTLVENGEVGDIDQLLLDAEPASYEFTHQGNDLLISRGAAILVVKDHFASNHTGLEKIIFPKGVEWDRTRIEAEAWYRGTAGDDTLEVIAGDNRLSGGKGADTYKWGSGYGNDRILDNGDPVGAGSFDQLILVNLLASDVSASRSENDLVLKINLTGETLIVQNQFLTPIHSLEQIAFADGVVWDAPTIVSKAWVYGTDGNDELENRAANQTILGGTGSDTYIWNEHSGLVILDDGNAADHDVLRLSRAATTYSFTHQGDDLIVNLGAGTFFTVKDHFLSAQTGIERIIFTTGSTNWMREQIEAEAWYRGTAGDDSLEVIAGSNRLSGGDGSDTYRWGTGYGNDQIFDNGDFNSVDQLVMVNLLSSQVTLSRSGYDLLIADSASGETLTVQKQFAHANSGLEKVVFSDGLIWDGETISANAWIRGTDGIDMLSSSAINQTISGGTGSDSYIWNEHTGAVILEGGDVSDIDTLNLKRLSTSYSFTHQGNDLVIHLSAGTHLTIKDHFLSTQSGIEWIRFTSGSTTILWSRDEIDAESWYRGTVGDDTLEVIAGDNRISGGNGSDTYRWGSGYGNDIVWDNGDRTGVDQLILVNLLASDVTVSRNEKDLVITANASGEKLTVQNHFWNVLDSLEQIVFADGVVWDAAAIGTESWIRGTNGSDMLASSAANQTIAGGTGSDTYTWNEHAGVVVLENGNASDIDILKLNRASTSYSFTHQGFDLLINLGSQTLLTVRDHFLSTETGIERIRFTSGSTTTTWMREQIDAEAWYRGTAGDDTLEVIAGDNRLTGGKGSDIYRWGSGYGNDLILDNGDTTGVDQLVLVNLLASDLTVSRSGNDLVITANASGETLTVQGHFSSYLYSLEQIVFADGVVWDGAAIAANAWIRGTSGNDTLASSAVNQTIAGGFGTDTYTWNESTGVIIREEGDSANNDTLKLNRAATSYNFTHQGDDLIVSLASSTLTIKDHFLSRQTGIERILFTTGNINWTREQIEAEAWYRGTTGDDTLEVVAGDNRLTGGNGSDTYGWGVGYGNDRILENGDATGVDQIALVNLLESDVTASRNGNDLIITANASGERLTVQGHFSSYLYSLEQVVFADGVVWDGSAIAANAWVYGTNGNDALASSAANQTLAGGLGSDTYTWNSHTDGVIRENGNAANIDTLKMSGGSTSYKFTRQGSDLVVNLRETTLVTIKDHFLSEQTGVERINFSFGNTTWTREQIEAEAWYGGTTGDDTLEVITGNNRLSGGWGSDTYRWGTGYGNDRIWDDGDATSVDQLLLVNLLPSDVEVSRNGFDLVVLSIASGERLTVQGQFSPYSDSLERIVFADYSVWNKDEIAWIRGTVENNTLNGTGIEDTIFGAGGADTLSGSAGVDKFVIALDGAPDLITDFAPTLGETIALDARSFGLSKDTNVGDYITFLGTPPDDAHGYFIVNQTGVSWDADGTGIQQAVSVVNFQSATSGITATNFAFV